MTQKLKVLRTITYDELTGGLIRKPVIEALVKSGELDEDGYRRLRHAGKFFERLGRSARPDLKIGEVWAEKDLQRLWRETAEQGDDEMPTRPLLDCQFPPD